MKDSAQQKRRHDPDRQGRRHHSPAFAQQHPHDGPTIGPEGESDPDFPGPLLNRVRHDPIDAEGRSRTLYNGREGSISASTARIGPMFGAVCFPEPDIGRRELARFRSGPIQGLEGRGLLLVAHRNDARGGCRP